MLVIERRRLILEQLRRRGAASVRDLATSVGTAEVTVRRDLSLMARGGLVHRTHGGATIPRWSEHPGTDYYYGRRPPPSPEELEMAAAASEVIRAGDAIVLGGGGTTIALALRLASSGGLTVITNSLLIADVLRDAPGIDLLLAGGSLHRQTMTLVGLNTDQTLLGMRTAVAFVSADGLSARHGLSVHSLVDAASVRAIASVADRLVALIDQTAIGRDALCQVVPCSSVDIVITGPEADAVEMRRLREAGVETRIAGDRLK